MRPRRRVQSQEREIWWSCSRVGFSLFDKVTGSNRQAPDAFSGRGENCVRERGGYGRNAGLSDSGRVFLAGHDKYFDGRSFKHPQHGVVIEITLLDSAFFESDFGF